MNYYGKKSNELTDLEKELVHVDSLLCCSMEMFLKDEKLISGNPQYDMTSGTHEDIEEKFYTRSSIVCEILGIENPNEETIFGIIEKTPYNIQKFCVEHTTRMGRPNDVYYHFCMKCREEKELELV